MYLPSLPEGFTWHQFAQTRGVQFAPDNYEKSGNSPLKIASGNRVDSIPRPRRGWHKSVADECRVGRNRHRPRRQGARLAGANAPPPVTLLWVDVSGDGPEMQLIPKEKLAPLPRYLTDITDKDVAGHTRTIKFRHGGPGRRSGYDQRRAVQRDRSGQWVASKVNTVEEMTIVNNAQALANRPPVSYPYQPIPDNRCLRSKSGYHARRHYGSGR